MSAVNGPQKPRVSAVRVTLFGYRTFMFCCHNVTKIPHLLSIIDNRQSFTFSTIPLLGRYCISFRVRMSLHWPNRNISLKFATKHIMVLNSVCGLTHCIKKQFKLCSFLHQNFNIWKLRLKGNFFSMKTMENVCGRNINVSHILAAVKERYSVDKLDIYRLLNLTMQMSQRIIVSSTYFETV